ncbi:transposase [Labrys monachus]|uniref:Transposase n=2 Tax=Labrys monachus TaxID=217067 RepID=A0ABU0FBJ9_9HYPH|nr:transposase [Labrys monachus]
MLIHCWCRNGSGLMRGVDVRTESLFSYVSCEARVPADHPLRAIRAIVDEALEVLSPEFDKLYSRHGRPSIPPEKLLRALLLQAFFTIRSERQLMEQMDYNLMFRWFAGLSMDAPIWDVTVFTKNRERLQEGDIAAKFLAALLSQPRVTALLSEDHFSVDGTLIEAWASIKGFKPKADRADSPDKDDDGGSGSVPPASGAAPEGKPAGGRNAERDFHGEKRSNRTHASTSDPDARLYKKGRGAAARLCHMGHFLMENRHGLIVDTELTLATGTAEREAALSMLRRRNARHRITVAADKAYDVAGFVADLRSIKVTPHVAQNTTNRRSAIDGRTTRHAGYALSQRIRKRIEEGFGWIKTCGGLSKTRHRGTERVGWSFTLTAAACNLIRLPKLIEIKG